MKKRVIFITEALWIGGIETALVNLLNHMDYERFDVTLLVTRASLEMSDQVNSNCRLIISDREQSNSFEKKYRYSRLYHLTEKSEHPSKLHRALMWLTPALRWIENRLYIGYVRKNMRGEHFDTAVIYSDRTAEMAVKALRADGYLMFYHNADIGRAYHDTIGYRKSKRVVTVSKAQCEKLKKLIPAYAGKMITIHNYVDAEHILKMATKLDADPLFHEEGIHIVSCGRLAPQKGFDLAIDACSMLMEDGFTDLHWYILGNGTDNDTLSVLCREKGVEDHFHLVGAKQNPFPYMKAADLYIQPSRSEGYSLSILEARVLCCPIIATEAAAGEQLTDGVDGTLCAPEASCIYSAVKKHLKTPELSQKYRSALARHSFDEENAQIIEEVEALL